MLGAEAVATTKLPACGARTAADGGGAPGFQPAEKLGPPGDVWALGLVAYRLFLGRWPLAAIDGPNGLNGAHLEAWSDLVQSPGEFPIRADPDLRAAAPENVLAAIEHMLVKDRTQRGTAEEVLRLLD